MSTVTPINDLVGEQEFLVSCVNDLEFIDNVDEFRCVKCAKIKLQHYLPNCGHILCYNCHILVNHNKKNKCCKCHKPLSKLILTCKFDEAFFEMKAFCPNKKYGCDYSGTLKDILDHLKISNFMRESCLPIESNNLPIVNAILSKLQEMDNKVNKIDSVLIKMEERVTKLEEYNENHNLDLNVASDKNSTGKLNMKDLQNKMKTHYDLTHKTGEAITKISASLSSLKQQCLSKVKSYDSTLDTVSQKLDVLTPLINAQNEACKIAKEDIEKIVITSKDNLQEQLDDLNCNLQTLEKSFRDFKQEKQEMSNQFSMYNADCYGTLLYTWKIDDLAHQISKMNIELSSDVFPIDGYEFGAKILFKIYENGNAYFAIDFQDYQKTGVPLKFDLASEIIYVMKDQTKRSEDKVRSDIILFNSNLKFDHFYCEKYIDKKNNLKNIPYNRDDSIEFQVYMQPKFSAKNCFSTDGILTGQISHFQKKKFQAMESLILYEISPYFYTSPEGYRIQVKIWTNGYIDFENNGVSVVVYFVQGEFDSFLPKEFEHTTIITIFNKTDHSKLIVKSLDKSLSDEQHYLCDVATHNELETMGYLDNDKLYYKVEIKLR